MILRAELRAHRRSLGAIFILVLLIALLLPAAITLPVRSASYLGLEMDRLDYGALTAWVSGQDADLRLLQQLALMDEIDHAEAQRIILTNYEVLGMESDSEGQLVVHGPGRYDYRLFSDGLRSGGMFVPDIPAGSVYVPASFVSIYGAAPGDTVSIHAARNGVRYDLTIAGFYEDPFLGSSMIGIKSLLISETDYETLAALLTTQGANALSRPGAMLHIFPSEQFTGSIAELNQRMNRQTTLGDYLDFIYSRSTMEGFMLLLQNVFCGIFLAFVCVLVMVAALVLRYVLLEIMERDRQDLGRLKTIGLSASGLKRLLLLEFGIPIGTGMLLGVTLCYPVSALLAHMTVTTTGILFPANPPLWAVGLIILTALGLLGIVYYHAGHIAAISPLSAILARDKEVTAVRHKLPIRQRFLTLRLSLRALSSHRKQYFSTLLVALLLVLFASLVGRLNAWLGPDGRGLMDAFNPADHDLGVQTFNQIPQAEVEDLIREFSALQGRYALAMPSVALNGTDYTANVISDGSLFHILRGRACTEEDEIVLTEFLLRDQGLSLGDTVTLSVGARSGAYTVVGTYQCANDMGDNFGMTSDGYLRLHDNDPSIWCIHYFLRDSDKKPEIMAALEDTYGDRIHVHENAWPGLYGILSAMKLLLVMMWAVIALFVMVSVAQTTSRVLYAQRRELAIYRSQGCSIRQLRQDLSLRIGIVALTGSLIGMALSFLAADRVIGFVMTAIGISGFQASPTLGAVLAPVVLVPVLHLLLAWAFSRSLQKSDLPSLLNEES